MKALVGTLLCCAALSAQPLTDREKALLDRIEQLERRVAALEAKEAAPSTAAAVAAPPAADSPAPMTSAAGATLNVYLDGYYGWNFNRPASRVNGLRFNDTQANSFTLNQAGVILERAPEVSEGRRFGARLDLMFGQNTEPLQGNPGNEPRPEIYRNIFQAYGTYVAPVGKGLTVDFGKFASSIGIEGNYAYEDVNYSRSLLFAYLPAYHMGMRATYNFSDRVSGQYWLVNGLNQTEDFNGFKSQAFLATVKPAKAVSWSLNYYRGREARTGNALTRIYETYASWSPGNWTLAGEFDRILAGDARITAGAAYAQYQFTPKWRLGGRFEYFRDPGGAFGGEAQNLKEHTVTATYQPAESMQLRLEYRRDWSGLPYFATAQPGVLKREQNTGLLGLIWWFGGKREAW